MTTFWSLYVTVLTLGTIFSLTWLLLSTRKGQREEFPLLSLSLGVVHLHPSNCANLDAAQLAGLASEAKRHAKNVPGYSLHIIDTHKLTA